MARRRVDLLLVERGLAESTSQAQALILAGNVLSTNGARIDKAGTLLADDAELSLKGQQQRYVSRGGLKLEAALQAFAVDVAGAVCLDIGASTGGFTDCLLQAGAAKVYAVDVGYGQIAWSLRQDPRVVVIERSNIRHLAAEQVPEPCAVIVIDVSFISLEKVVPPGLRFAAPNARLIALVKPQFEVARQHIAKGGIVRDPQARQDALDQARRFLAQQGFVDLQAIDSPIVGAKGNREYLLSGVLSRSA